MSAADKYAEADALEARAKQLREEANALRMEEGRQRPLAERLTYAATARCKCGAGLAYDPYQEDRPGSPFRGPDAWECSALLLSPTPPTQYTKGMLDSHTAPLPFSYYEIKSENQPSACGATTRPKPDPEPAGGA